MNRTKSTKALGRLFHMLCLIVAAAQTATVSAQEAAAVTVEQLRSELAERDAVIIDLMRRVQVLETALDGGRPTAEGADAAAAVSRNSARAVAARRDTGDAPAGLSAQARRDPRLDGIDELRALRALERGLVEEGASLLPPGQFEFTSDAVLTHDQGMFPTALMLGDASAVGEIEQTFDIYEQNGYFRIGLPFEAQLNVGLPYRVVEQDIETGVDGMVRSVDERSGSGFGDVTLGLAKVLAEERNWRPNLIGQLVWISGSGDERDGDLFLGGGLEGLSAQLNAYWRRDPVVFLMSGGYTQYRDGGMLSPGDSIDFSLGLGLAVSPETALMFSLDQRLSGEYEQDGIELPGTDRLSSALGLSASTILGRRLSLRVRAGVGLTDDAPDYRFGVSLASRFGLR